MSPFSVRIREEVLAAFPEWAPHAEEETYKGSAPYLVVTISPPPEAKTDLPLRISTWDEEVTVDFDYYPPHFDRWNPDDGDDRHKSALLYVRAILEEQVAAASWWQEDACKVCSQFEPGQSLEPRFKVSYSKVRVRSWRGTLNADSDAYGGGCRHHCCAQLDQEPRWRARPRDALEESELPVRRFGPKDVV